MSIKSFFKNPCNGDATFQEFATQLLWQRAFLIRAPVSRFQSISEPISIQPPWKNYGRRKLINSTVSHLLWSSHADIGIPLLVHCIIIVILLLEMADFY